MNMEIRPDCDEFELKTHGWQNGMCQTDGHYLCGNCKHIAPFEDMELSDNMERYYPHEYKERLQRELDSIDETGLSIK